MRLIDGDALLRVLGVGEDCDNCQYKQGVFCKQSSGFVDACEAIADAPTIEPEQLDIIRCKDCKYSSSNGIYGCILERFSNHDESTRLFADDYCSAAERREE